MPGGRRTIQPNEVAPKKDAAVRRVALSVPPTVTAGPEPVTIDGTPFMVRVAGGELRAEVDVEAEDMAALLGGRRPRVATAVWGLRFAVESAKDPHWGVALAQAAGYLSAASPLGAATAGLHEAGLRALCFENSEVVRQAVASNEHTPSDALAMLLADPDAGVRERALRNPGLFLHRLP